jgi:protein associated with RNAse G/E
VRGDILEYIDLALDLLVFPDGSQRVLDEDEFNALDIPAEFRSAALQGMAELRSVFRNRTG